MNSSLVNTVTQSSKRRTFSRRPPFGCSFQRLVIIFTSATAMSLLLSSLGMIHILSDMVPSVRVRSNTESVRMSVNETVRMSAAPPDTRCILYDRPPRTGSTTISYRLDECLQSKGYPSSTTWFKGVPMQRIVTRMLQQPSRFKSHLTRHMYLSADDVLALRRSCGQVFFVTSARTMEERLLSRAKYELLDKDQRRHRNRKVSVQEFNVAKGKIQDVREVSEPYYESYPYTGGAELDPDYVIRSSSFQKDFSELLSSLGCGAEFASHNVHWVDNMDNVTFDGDGLTIEPKMGNARFITLRRLAEKHNAKGLRKASVF